MYARADDELQQNKRDIVKAPEGRYIGGVHDTSAPTDILFIVLKAITGGTRHQPKRYIGTYGHPVYCVKSHNRRYQAST
jgi:hypothetical protein